MIPTYCPTCKGSLAAPDELAGKPVRCTGCQNILTVPLPAVPTPPAPPPPEKPTEPASKPRPKREPIDDLEEVEPLRPRRKYLREEKEPRRPGWISLQFVGALRIILWMFAGGYAGLITLAYWSASRQVYAVQQAGTATDHLMGLAGPMAIAFAADRLLVAIRDLTRDN